MRQMRASVHRGKGALIEPLRWSDTFAVGHPELDAEHRLMVELISEICVTQDRERDATSLSLRLHRLEDVTERHFLHEETVLASIRSDQDKRHPWLADVLDAAIRDHSAEHERMLNQLRAISRKALGAREAAAWAECCEELKAWFVDHAIEYESQIKTVLQSV